MASFQRSGCFAQKNWASKAPIGPLSHLSDRSNHEDLLRLNKPRPLGALALPPKAFVLPPKALKLDIIQYTLSSPQKMNLI